MNYNMSDIYCIRVYIITLRVLITLRERDLARTRATKIGRLVMANFCQLNSSKYQLTGHLVNDTVIKQLHIDWTRELDYIKSHNGN